MRGATVDFEIPAHIATAASEVARESGATTFMVMHAALAVLLARLAATDDVVIGTAVAGRGRAELDDLIGMFVNTVVLRTPVRAGERFVDVLDTVRRTDLDALVHADVPFSELVDRLDVVRSEAFAPLVQVLFTVAERSEHAERGLLDLGDSMTVEAVEAEIATAKVDLTIGVVTDTGPGPWRGTITYASDLFDAASVTDLAARWVRLLDALVARPDTQVADAEILGTGEIAELVPPTTVDAPPPLLLADLLAAAALATPDAVAVVDGSRSLTYRELDTLSSAFARDLIAAGVGPDDVVVSAVRRSALVQVALWAVAKSGAVYCPVDPRYPADRVRRVIADSGARVGFVGPEISVLADVGIDAMVLDDSALAALRTRISSGAVSAEPVTDTDRVRPLRAHNGAYMIYTSGSTGVPKGVLVTHTGLAGVAYTLRDHHHSDASARWLGISSPAFDAAMLEVLGTYVTGATMVVTPADIVGGAELADWITANNATHAFLVPRSRRRCRTPVRCR